MLHVQCYQRIYSMRLVFVDRVSIALSNHSHVLLMISKGSVGVNMETSMQKVRSIYCFEQRFLERL